MSIKQPYTQRAHGQPVGADVWMEKDRGIFAARVLNWVMVFGVGLGGEVEECGEL